MELIPVDILQKADLEFIEKLYIESFPRNERRPLADFHDLIENESDYVVLLIVNDDKERIGFITYWKLDLSIFAEHFAIAPEYRNGGNGKNAVELFLSLFDKPIILEAEIPDTDIAKRRINFYERLKFKVWKDIEYVQPPYESEFDAIPMSILTYGNIDVEKNLELIKHQLNTKVYRIN
ncbi:MAG: GNAT family N-acetyltransferase [Dysgonomonas sp.]